MKRFRDYEVSPGFNLYVDTTTRCNGACRFCIAHNIGRHDGPGFMSGLRFGFGMTESVGGTVQVVGGEPSISERLPAVISAVRGRRFRRIVFGTNGTGLDETVITALARIGTKHVNISRQHHDEQVNQRFMRLSPVLSNPGLAERIQTVKAVGMRPRLQAVLLRGGLEKFKDVYRFLEWAGLMGCMSVSLSEAFPLHLFDYQRGDAGYVREAYVDPGPIVRCLDESEEFHVAPQDRKDYNMWGGSLWLYGRRRNWIGPWGTRISIKTLSGFGDGGIPKRPEYDKATDPELQPGKLAFAVVHPDGRVTASWDRRERVLFRPEKRMAVNREVQL